MRHKLMLVLLALMLTSSANAGWFGGDHDRLNKVENELHEQKQTSDIVVGILGIGCAVLFGIGTAIGSKARKEVKKNE